MSLAVKPVGEPDAANPHVRFDERGREPGRRLRSHRALPRLYLRSEWRPWEDFFSNRKPIQVRKMMIAGVPTGVYWRVKARLPVCRLMRKLVIASLLWLHE